MNRIILVICSLALLLSVVNTVLLVQVSKNLKETADKVAPLTRAVQNIEPLLRTLEKRRSLPGGGRLPGVLDANDKE